MSRPSTSSMQARQALVAWAVYFPAGADALAADFSTKLANATAAGTIWALSSFFQVGFVPPTDLAPYAAEAAHWQALAELHQGVRRHSAMSQWPT